jgi:hypothetical protein
MLPETSVAITSFRSTCSTAGTAGDQASSARTETPNETERRRRRDFFVPKDIVISFSSQPFAHQPVAYTNYGSAAGPIIIDPVMADEFSNRI